LAGPREDSRQLLPYRSPLYAMARGKTSEICAQLRILART
jgi:hypothetical protein